MGFLRSVLGGGKRKAFGEELIGLLEEHRELLSAQLDADGFRVLLEDALGQHVMSLEDGYARYAGAAADQRSQVVAELAASMIRTINGVPSDYEAAQPHLFPYLRQRIYYEVKPLHAEATGVPIPSLPHASVTEDLAVEVVYQGREGVTALQDRHFASWNRQFESILQDALANFRKQADKRWSVPEARVYLSPWRGHFDASALLFGDLMRDFRVIGRPVVMAPVHDTLILTGSNDQHGLAKMLDLTEEIMRESEYFLSTIPLVLDDNEWAPFNVSHQHRLYRRLRLLYIEQQLRDYTAQKEALDSWYERQGGPMHVADLTAVDNPNTGRVYSYCVWPNQSPPVLLPKADRIYFMDDPDSEKADVAASWDRVMEVLGEEAMPMPVYPARYQVAGYPTTEQFAAFS